MYASERLSVKCGSMGFVPSVIDDINSRKQSEEDDLKKNSTDSDSERPYQYRLEAVKVR
jgi:hypothetical protein